MNDCLRSPNSIDQMFLGTPGAPLRRRCAPETSVKMIGLEDLLTRLSDVLTRYSNERILFVMGAFL